MAGVALLRALRAEQRHATDLLAGPVRDIGPTLRLMSNGIEWMYVAWAKRDLWKKDPMHPDIPGLVIKERELRP